MKQPTFSHMPILVCYARVIAASLKLDEKGREQLLLGSGLSPHALDSDESMISYEQHRCVVLNALRMSGNPAIGLHIGAMAPLSTHGAMAYAALSSPNVQSALEMFVRYSETRAGFLRLEARTESGALKITLHERTDLGALRYFMHEVVMLSAKALLDTTIGPNTPGPAMQFGYPAPGHAKQYASTFGMPVTFGATTTTIVIPEELLTRRCVTADPKLFRIAERQCEQELAALRAALPFSTQVQAVVVTRLEGACTQGEIANHFCISVRTLVRRLALEGLSFRQLVDTARRQTAQRYLLDTDFTIAEIAQRLGYLDPSNFGRAARNWFGVSPSAFRATHSGVSSATI
jgi:AraC-like DNA-binding protein